MKKNSAFYIIHFIASLCYCDVIISQYYEGASNNKWIEVTNVGDAVVDLTDYYIARWSGTDTPSGSPTNFSKLSDIGITSIAVGEVILFQNSSAVLPSYATGTHTTATYFNGDDPVALTVELMIGLTGSIVFMVASQKVNGVMKLHFIENQVSLLAT